MISNQDTEIRRRVLNKLESEPSLTFQEIPEVIEKVVNVRQDSMNIEESGVSQIKKKDTPKETNKQKKNGNP